MSRYTSIPIYPRIQFLTCYTIMILDNRLILLQSHKLFLMLSNCVMRCNRYDSMCLVFKRHGNEIRFQWTKITKSERIKSEKNLYQTSYEKIPNVWWDDTKKHKEKKEMSERMCMCKCLSIRSCERTGNLYVVCMGEIEKEQEKESERLMEIEIEKAKLTPSSYSSLSILCLTLKEYNNQKRQK